MCETKIEGAGAIIKEGKASFFRRGICLYPLILIFLINLGAGCASRARTPYKPYQPAKKQQIKRMGYSIQVGAFSNARNAARLTDALKGEGLDAYYFVQAAKVYKVRFGNFPTEKLARSKAESLRSQGVIDEFYIVKPGDYAVARTDKPGGPPLRDEIVRTARNFIGVPYLWGGSSSEEGFDCSGLTMAVYQYNGLDLPRSSCDQFEYGASVEKSNLSRGDLVFFKTSGGKKVSHVGVYIGDGRFIHAPGRGKKIREDSLSSRYFAKRFVGGRSYI